MTNFVNIPLQPTSESIWDSKHRLKDDFGNPIDKNREDTLIRVAKTLAQQEDDPEVWEERFSNIVLRGCIPAGRILSNAGAGKYKPNTTLINCVVASNINDSLDDILKVAHEVGLTLKTGAGIGMCFSTIRPKGAFVKGVGAYTSGPLSFADVYDKICFTISSAGGRRGSMMLTFHVFHPDVYDVIKVKRENGRLRQFNISLLITDEFINAVKNDTSWPLYFPIHKDDPHLKEEKQTLYADWPIDNVEYYTYRDDGKVLCKIYKIVSARHLWDEIMRSNYDFGDPGFILIDKVNRENNLYFTESIICTNPCGEQPLPEHSNCLLGSVNLVKYIDNPFSNKVSFNFNQFKDDVYIFNRMLDNVIEISNLPLDSQRIELYQKRRHGIGYLGVGSMFNMMKLRYGDPESVKLISKISKILAETSIRAGIDLAIEKGPAPIMDTKFTITKKLLNKYPYLKLKNYFKEGDTAFGKELLVHSQYMSRMPKNLTDQIVEVGMRFSHATSIAPTGTMALGIENNVSNGIEPTYEHITLRNVIKTGKKAKEAVTVYSYEMLLYKSMFGENAEMPDYFVSSSDITPMEHINIQAAAQPYIDSAISKCIAKGTRVITNKGFIKIESFSNNKEPNVFEDVENDIYALCSDDKFYKISSHYCDGIQPTKRITFDNGIVKEVSCTHKFIDAKTYKWKAAEDFNIGDVVVYRAAQPIEFNDFNKEHYGFIHGILRNKSINITKEKIITDLNFINLDKFCSIINSLKDLRLVCENNIIKLDENSYNFINKLKYEFSFNKLFASSISERTNYIYNIRTSINKEDLFQEKFELKEEAQTISELLYSIGKDSVVVNKTTVIELSKKYISSTFIPTSIIKIEDRECEVFDISVDDKHEYLIHGIVAHNTINCPTEISYEDFKQIYIDAYDNGLKGCALFRYNPESHQGVLVKEDNLKATKYKINLEDNSEIILSGNEVVQYEHENSTVANLYDALKEGYYNKF